MKDVKVSIICITYNHALYITDAIDSFINQKTDFDYEIIIHDDASTDGTQEILRNYEKRFPDKIRVIYEEENQYSKNISVICTYIMPEVRGEYFALCEGDDYWIDEHKLQKQLEYMQEHQECTLCIHNAIKVNRNKKQVGKVETVKENQIVTIKDVILGGGGFCATNSIFSRIDLLNKYYNSGLLNLDYALQIYLTGLGYCYCFEDYMSAYRVNVSNSWTVRSKQDVAYGVEFEKKIIDMLYKYNEMSEYKYNDVISTCISKHQLVIYMKLEDYQTIKHSKELMEYVNKMSGVKRAVYLLRIYMGMAFPRFTSEVTNTLKSCRNMAIDKGIK